MWINLFRYLSVKERVSNWFMFCCSIDENGSKQLIPVATQNQLHKEPICNRLKIQTIKLFQSRDVQKCVGTICKAISLTFECSRFPICSYVEHYFFHHFLRFVDVSIWTTFVWICDLLMKSLTQSVSRGVKFHNSDNFVAVLSEFILQNSIIVQLTPMLTGKISW